jgi:hypothetical protein
MSLRLRLLDSLSEFFGNQKYFIILLNRFIEMMYLKAGQRAEDRGQCAGGGGGRCGSVPPPARRPGKG